MYKSKNNDQQELFHAKKQKNNNCAQQFISDNIR